MKTKEEIRTGVSDMLRTLREKKGLTKSRMAALAGVDVHTWCAWESGRSCPSIVDFISVYESSGVSIMKSAMEFLYSGSENPSDDRKRIEMINFINNVSTDHMVEVMHFLVYGEHGSSFAPQLETFCAYNHLPLEQRFLIAESIYVAYNMHAHLGDLAAASSVQPSLPIMEDGLKQAQKAAYKRMKSYTAITGEEEKQ